MRRSPRASPQSLLGARAFGLARRGLVQARDLTKARRVYARGDRGRDGLVARSLLARPGVRGRRIRGIGKPCASSWSPKKRLARWDYAAAWRRFQATRPFCFGKASHMGNLARIGLSTAAVALFAACGGSQQIGQTAFPQLQQKGASTPLPGGTVWYPASRPLQRYPQSSQPLLYVGDDGQSAVDIFPLTGPNQQQIGTVSNGVDSPWGLSIDANKSLYVANSNTVTVYPYGSTIPSMTYSPIHRALYALADSAGHVFVIGFEQPRCRTCHRVQRWQ